MRRILQSLFTIIVLLGGLAFYTYYQPHKDIKQTKADYTLNATNLFSEFEQDELSANDKYLDKLIQVSGTVKEVSIENNKIISISLESHDVMFGIICQLDEHTKHLRSDFKEGEKVTFKGVCTGMLMDVVLVRCVET